MTVTAIRVNSDDPWIDTGIDVTTSQTLHISAAGVWSPVTHVGYTDPDGFPNNYVPTDYPIEGIGAFSGDNFFNLSGNIANLTNHWGALCGYIGTPGTNEPPAPGSYDAGNPNQAADLAKGANIFLIGSNYNHLAPATGRLYMRSSDDAYTDTLSDNAGFIIAYITTDTIPDGHTPYPSPECGDIYTAFPFNTTAGGALTVWAWRNISGTYHLIRAVKASGFTDDSYILSESSAFDSNNNFYFAVTQGLNVYILKLETSNSNPSNAVTTFWSMTLASGDPEIVIDIDQNDIIYAIVQTDDPVMDANLYRLSTSGTVLTGPTSIGPGRPASFNDPGYPTAQGSLSGCAVAADGSVIAYSDNYFDSDLFDDDSRIKRWNIGTGSQMSDLGGPYPSSCPEVHGIVYDADGNLWAGIRFYFEKYTAPTYTASDFFTTLEHHRYDIANSLDSNVLIAFEDKHVLLSFNRTTTARTELARYPANEDMRCTLAVRCAATGTPPPPPAGRRRPFAVVIS